MAKRIEIDGKFYRTRRGKWVEIPGEWVGQTVCEQTIRKRPSKMTRKARRMLEHTRPSKGHPRHRCDRHSSGGRLRENQDG